MGVAIRVIPCLDVDQGRVVKGVNFEGLRDAGDPVELGAQYNEAGADELTFLDVTASTADRETTFDVVQKTAETVFIPLTVGGGVRSVDDVDKLLRTGADKVSINTAAINNPQLINDIAERFGSQVLVLSVDAKQSENTPSGYEITTHGGKTSTGIDALEWVAEAEKRGVGEILLNSIDADGTKTGFDIPMIQAVRSVTKLPLIASGGAGAPEHFPPAIEAGANAVLAASIFHFGEVSIAEVKDAIRDAGYDVR
ncbi:imidazole glycerol phosphate synthase subunit HisF [Rothia sp. P7208]|uniref:imidazole glycerol phosphate synthase subunit HisF n=1 Tax=Rothia sp. P7208 TaxID=3402660 RepID=UPI003ACCB32B